MKTKFNTRSRILSLLLSVCMVAVLFTCLTVIVTPQITVSASTSDTNLFHVTTSATAKRIGWRSSTQGSHLSVGVKYRISLDWENISNAPFGSTTFSIYSRINESVWGNIWNNSSYVDDWSISSYELSHGYHYDIDFKIKSTLSGCRELVFYFGDIGKNISSMEFKTANWMLYTRDDSNNLTATGMTPTFGSADFREASSGAMDSFVSTYSSQANNTYFWTDYLGSNFSCAFETIPSGYFARSQMVHIKPGVNSTWTNIGYKGGSIAGSSYYRFTMDECAVAGIKSTVNLFVDSGYQTTVGKRSDTYDGTTRTVEFYLGGTRSSFFLLLGNYGNGALMNSYFKKPKLYKITELGGDITGDNLINDFTASNIVAAAGASRNGAASGKWTVLNYASSAFGYAPVDPSCFGISEQILHHKAGYGDYHYIMQRLPALSTSSYYQLTLKECQKGGEKSYISINVNYSSTGLGVVYDKFDGINRTIVFQTGTNSDAYSKATLMLGSFNYSTALETYYSEPELYKLTASPASGGVITGDNLIVGFSASTVDLSTTKARNNAPLGKWVPIGTNYEAFESVYTASDPFYTVNPGGDYNGDGTVDIFDYMIYKKVRLDTKLGTAGSSLQASCYTGYSKDVNDDGDLDSRDFAELRSAIL